MINQKGVFRKGVRKKNCINSHRQSYDILQFNDIFNNYSDRHIRITEKSMRVPKHHHEVMIVCTFSHWVSYFHRTLVVPQVNLSQEICKCHFVLDFL